MKKIRRFNEWFDIDVHDAEEEQEKQEAKESTKEEVLKMVDDYHKKDKSIGMALADRIDKEVILSKAQEILLGNIGKLANFLKELINTDKNRGEVQKVINGLTTAPEPAKEEKPVEKSTPDPTPSAIAPEDLDDIVVYKYLQSHPDFFERLKKGEVKVEVKTVPIYIRRDVYIKRTRNGEKFKPEEILKKTEVESDAILYYDGDYEKMCAPEGMYYTENRIADSKGEPTDIIFEDPKKS